MPWCIYVFTPSKTWKIYSPEGCEEAPIKYEEDTYQNILKNRESKHLCIVISS